jgi:hypothetical protein
MAVGGRFDFAERSSQHAAEIETVQQAHGCLQHKLNAPAWKNPQHEA